MAAAGASSWAWEHSTDDLTRRCSRSTALSFLHQPPARGGGRRRRTAGPTGAPHTIFGALPSLRALSPTRAGKVQRKFLLLAAPAGDVAAALVEASKYCYLYRSTAPRQEHGEHQVRSGPAEHTFLSFFCEPGFAGT